jgi:GTP cyclohydrolase III
MFIFLDGDDVGVSLEQAIWSDNVDEYVRRSAELTNFFHELARDLADAGASVLTVGGDSILATVAPEGVDVIVAFFSKRQQEDASICFSVGLGSTLASAHTALRVAKSSGKARLAIR